MEWYGWSKWLIVKKEEPLFLVFFFIDMSEPVSIVVEAIDVVPEVGAVASAI